MGFTTPEFWIALMQIILVNIVLSGDNAVVIALASRGLPAEQQKKAIFWGSGAAVVMRIVLTIVAVELLRMPYLKLVGACLLLWIALQLLIPEDEGEGHGNAGSTLAAAIKTILLADLVMSLDNVIAVAAAAKGSVTLLVVGLAVSIPLVVFASTWLLTLMTRWPVIVTFGAALLGWVAGEMAISDPAVAEWINANAAYLHWVAPAAGALGIVAAGRFMAKRAEARQAAALQVAAPQQTAPGLKRVLLGVDGSDGSAAAVRHLLAMRQELRDPASLDLHLINVQRSLPGDVSMFVGDKPRDEYHKELSDAAMVSARSALDTAGLRYQVHQHVGEPGNVIAAVAGSIGASMIVLGARGLGSNTGGLLGSVARSTSEHATVPVLLAR